ncbi:transcriptional enhancer factor TEF-1 isoform X1 [Brachionus plicatilis]|uniref:Transcriptional enhancer factor TEF-1 isoform X1 n=1 Tax=Brachionus plicatilis TaxID=10195 RepID=A0A3M7QB67_BRAPC|nr:transcriptional enhancer factor TEF-1 isoform X1 [Brachionus plicatilis]
MIVKDTKDAKITGSFQNPFSNLTSAQIISPPSILQVQSQQQNLVVPSPNALLSNGSKMNNANQNVHQLKLIEFSGFVEKRRDPEIYHKHLFLHLNTLDYFASDGMDDFEGISHKEFVDKFPESDLLSSIQSQDKTSICSSYLVKYWVDLNYIMEEGVNALYAVTNIIFLSLCQNVYSQIARSTKLEKFLFNC